MQLHVSLPRVMVQYVVCGVVSTCRVSCAALVMAPVSAVSCLFSWFVLQLTASCAAMVHCPLFFVVMDNMVIAC